MGDEFQIAHSDFEDIQVENLFSGQICRHCAERRKQIRNKEQKLKLWQVRYPQRDSKMRRKGRFRKDKWREQKHIEYFKCGFPCSFIDTEKCYIPNHLLKYPG